jgi:hypothetical protein
VRVVATCDDFLNKQIYMKSVIELIEKRVSLAKSNPELPFIFKIGGGYNMAASDAKDKRNAVGDIKFPACVELVFDKDGTGMKAHTMLYKKNDDIFESVDRYKNAQGKFEEPKLPRINFVSGQKLIYGDSISNLNLIRYLSYIEHFAKDKRVELQDISKTINITNTLSAKQIGKYVILIEEMSKSEDGFEILKGIAKDSKLNPNNKSIDGLAKMEDGKEKIIELLESYLVSPAHGGRFVSLLLPDKNIADVINKLLSKKAIGYNKDTKSFQPKDEKGFTKEIIYETQNENEAVRAVLLGHYLQKDAEWKTKLFQMAG